MHKTQTLFCMTSPDAGASAPGVSLHLFSFEPLFYHCGPVTPGKNYLKMKIEIRYYRQFPSHHLSVKNIVSEESLSLVPGGVSELTQFKIQKSPVTASTHLKTPCPMILPATNSASRLFPLGYLMKPLPCSNPDLP